MAKKTVSITVDPIVWDAFQVTADHFGLSASNLVEMLCRSVNRSPEGVIKLIRQSMKDRLTSFKID